jgi:alpha-tubulin suppressor-like RCC1 family protein
MPNQFLSDEFGDIEDYFVTDYWLIDQFVGDQLWVWGSNENAKLGDNTTTNRNVPVTTFSGGTNWKQIFMGQNHTGAIKTDGSLWMWGNGTEGQLGNFATTNRSTPVTTFAGGNNWKSVACGSNHTAAIKTDGSLWVWGFESNGSLGTNGGGNRNTPVTTFAGGNNWKSVFSAALRTAAIKTDGSLWTWGNGGNGQLGINDPTDRAIPVTTFIGGNNWKQVSGGSSHTAAIKTDGSLWVWGSGGDGRLGTNDTTQRNTPVTTFAGGNNWKFVSTCLGSHSAAIKTDGSLWIWGGNTSVELGINNNNQKNTPVTTFAGGNNWKQVSCGDRFTVAIKTDGTLWGWGGNNNGELGINLGLFTNRSTPVTTFAGGNNWKQISAGLSQTGAVKSGLNVDLS